MSTAHALLSASSSHRWLICTPSVKLESTLPDPPKSSTTFDFSAEGTMAHSLAEVKLRHHYGQIDSEEFKREYDIIKLSQYYNEEFEYYVDNYVMFVKSQIGDNDKPLFEQKVDYSEWAPNGFGTADVVILSENSIHVIDLKFGKGIPVNAIDNSQLRLYSIGAWSKFKEEFPNIKELKYTIVQPRLDSITTDSTTLAKMLDWVKFFVAPKARLAWTGSGSFIAGDHCQWCKAKAICRARADYNSELAKLDFRDPPLLSEDELNNVLLKAQDLKTWVNDVEDFALNRAVHENKIPVGFKLSTSVTHRKITDQTLAAKVLLEKGLDQTAIFEPVKLKSIATLEKLAPKGQIVSWLGELVQRPEGQPKLVRDSANAADDFK
jgi:hypothetical protein